MSTSTASTHHQEERLCTVDARRAAMAWLNAFLASGQDKQRTTLFRTLSLEFHPEGIQFVAVSGIALFRTWVPRIELPGPVAWPANSETPRRVVTVMDVEKFGLSFMKTLHQLTAGEDRQGEQMAISIAPMDEGATLSLGAEFTKERVVIRTCGQRLDLPVMDGEYPNWRRLQLGIDERERVEDLILAPALMGAIGKLLGVSAVRLAFHGKEKQVGFEAAESPGGLAVVRGVLMPMRKTGQDTADTGSDKPAKKKDPKAARPGHLKLT